MSNDLNQIVDKLNKQGKMYFLEAATEDQIAEFEKENEVVLPLKYKEWLKFSDGGECFLPGGIQFYGVAHKPTIDINDDDRPNSNYVIIGALSTGDPILFKKNSEDVSIYNHEAGRIELDESYKDFFGLLNDLYDLLGIGE